MCGLDPRTSKILLGIIYFELFDLAMSQMSNCVLLFAPIRQDQLISPKKQKPAHPNHSTPHPWWVLPVRQKKSTAYIGQRRVRHLEDRTDGDPCDNSQGNTRATYSFPLNFSTCVFTLYF